MRARNLLYGVAAVALFALPTTALAQMATNPLPGYWPGGHQRGYHKICDADRDHCRWAPNPPRAYHRQCDEDGDDCWWAPQGKWFATQHRGNRRICDADGDDCRWVRNQPTG